MVKKCLYLFLKVQRTLTNKTEFVTVIKFMQTFSFLNKKYTRPPSALVPKH